jgi:hypothetical protein
MSSSFLPPHLTAQSLASQPVARPRPAAQPAAEGGFESLALKSAAPGRVILPRTVEQKAPEQAAPERKPQPDRQPAPPLTQRPAVQQAAPARPVTAAAPVAPSAVTPPLATPQPTSSTPALDEITRYTRPGSKLDIRV